MNITGASALDAVFTRSCMNVWLTLRPLRAVVVHSSRTPTMNSCSKLPKLPPIVGILQQQLTFCLCLAFAESFRQKIFEL